MATTPTYINQRINNLQAQINNLTPVTPVNPTLADILLNGNSAGTFSINMNSQDITSVDNIQVTTINGSAYPNPTSDKINIALNTTGKSTITVTDISGKIVLTTNNEFNGTELTISIEDFESGLYIFSVTLENGKTAQFNVVKK